MKRSSNTINCKVITEYQVVQQIINPFKNKRENSNKKRGLRSATQLLLVLFSDFAK